MNVSYNRCGNLAEEAKLGTTQFNYNLDPWCACEKKYLVYDQQYIGNKSQLRFGLAFSLDWHIHQVIAKQSVIIHLTISLKLKCFSKVK